ncbi:glucosyltransferase [Escherichia coli]|nr:glucosyltransferase [Escherichia coli]
MQPYVGKSEWFKTIYNSSRFEDFLLPLIRKPISAPSLARVRYRY